MIIFDRSGLDLAQVEPLSAWRVYVSFSLPMVPFWLCLRGFQVSRSFRIFLVAL